MTIVMPWVSTARGGRHVAVGETGTGEAVAAGVGAGKEGGAGSLHAGAGDATGMGVTGAFAEAATAMAASPPKGELSSHRVSPYIDRLGGPRNDGHASQMALQGPLGRRGINEGRIGEGAPPASRRFSTLEPTRRRRRRG